MSEEAATETTDNTATETAQESQQQDNGREASNSGKPAGYLPVDPETATPEEVKQRIDYLYRQVKDQGRHINDYRSIAQQQSDKINELMNGMGQVVDHLHTKSTAESETQLNQEMDAAFAAGDLKAYRESQKKLIDIGIKQQLTAQQKPQNQTRQMANAGTQVQSASEAIADPVVKAWQEEKDERGQPLRPWANTADVNDPDPDFLRALAIAKRVWSKNPHKSSQENLAEVDKQMGTRQISGGQNVMGGSLNTPGKKNRIVLSPSQERIAVKTKFGGREAKSDADHIAAYRKQIETVQSKTKGGR